MEGKESQANIVRALKKTKTLFKEKFTCEELSTDIHDLYKQEVGSDVGSHLWLKEIDKAMVRTQCPPEKILAYIVPDLVAKCTSQQMKLATAGVTKLLANELFATLLLAKLNGAIVKNYLQAYLQGQMVEGGPSNLVRDETETSMDPPPQDSLLLPPESARAGEGEGIPALSGTQSAQLWGIMRGGKETTVPTLLGVPDGDRRHSAPATAPCPLPEVANAPAPPAEDPHPTEDPFPPPGLATTLPPGSELQNGGPTTTTTKGGQPPSAPHTHTAVPLPDSVIENVAPLPSTTAGSRPVAPPPSTTAGSHPPSAPRTDARRLPEASM